MATDETSHLLPTADQNSTEPQQDAMSTLIWKTGAVFGATAVGLGAFGAHGLKKHISDPNKIANWSTAAQYQVRTHLASSPPILGLAIPHHCSSAGISDPSPPSSSTPSPCSSPATTQSRVPSLLPALPCLVAACMR